MNPWWQNFFDADYLHLWEGTEAPDKTANEVEGLWMVLGLAEGSRVLDAPCGYGRIARGLAERGARVVGVDRSADLLAEAERRRGAIPEERLRYQLQDLREPLQESGFDVALNIFSSLGYDTEAGDAAVLSTLRDAVRPGGLVFVETNHRDALVARQATNRHPAHRLADGTLFIEEPQFDPVTGCVDIDWYWSGPHGSGQKSSSMRLYSATELVALLRSVGLEVRSVHNGCSPEPFWPSASPSSNRLGLLAVRE
jgi:SAM-dependent methyltransferase